MYVALSWSTFGVNWVETTNPSHKQTSFAMNFVSCCVASERTTCCVSDAFLNEMIEFCSRWQIRGEEHGGVQAECSAASTAAGDRNCAHRRSPRGAARDGVAAPRLLRHRKLDCSHGADRQHRISTMCRQKYWRRSGECDACSEVSRSWLFSIRNAAEMSKLPRKNNAIDTRLRCVRRQTVMPLALSH